jgi:hypothetical protein
MSQRETTTPAAAASGRYIYCILDAASMVGEAADAAGSVQDLGLPGDIGIGGRPVHGIMHKDICAVVSTVPFRQAESKVDDVVAHQRVVEAARALGTVLPVRFGAIVNSKEGVQALLAASYTDYKSKLVKFRNKSEYGVKVLLGSDGGNNNNSSNSSGRQKIEQLVSAESDEIKKLKQELADKMAANAQGAAYFVKMRLQDALQKQVMKKIDRIAGDIHGELARSCIESRTLRTDVGQIILNASYLLDSSQKDAFAAKVRELETVYADYRLAFHVGGPWAPYSFC